MSDKSKLDSNDLPDNIWMIRPCEVYKDEYKDCKSLLSRVYQYYTDGSKQDCSQWLTDFDNCMKFRKSRDQLAAAALISVEQQRRNQRLKLAKANDVWEYRKAPPPEWFEPLPNN